MTQKEAQDYLLRVIQDASMRAGSQAKLAEEFGLKPAAVSLWVIRKRFPGRYAYRISKLVEGLHELERIHDAFFALKHPKEAS
jgi:DNA-binding transcriptional regulator YdaS (Cro superfamily)